MPIALRTVNISCLPLKSCAFSAPCCAHQALLIIATYCSFSGHTASGAASTKSIVCSSTFLTAASPRSANERCDVGPCVRSIEKTASSAVNGEPSWNFTPRRSLKRQVVGLTICHDSASAGSSLNCSSRETRLS